MCDDGIPGVENETPEALKDFAMEIYDVIRDIQDPEKPETLEELEVLTEDSVCVNYLDPNCDKRCVSQKNVGFCVCVLVCVCVCLFVCLCVCVLSTPSSTYSHLFPPFTVTLPSPFV